MINNILKKKIALKSKKIVFLKGIEKRINKKIDMLIFDRHNLQNELSIVEMKERNKYYGKNV
jgi:hypothetical protein